MQSQLPPRPTHELVTVHKGEIVGTDGTTAEIEINLPKITKRTRARGIETFLVRSRTSNKIYTVTRFGRRSIKLSCTCPAGEHGKGCHHKKSVRALLLSEEPKTTPKPREEVRRTSSGLAIKVPYSQRHLPKQHGGIWESQDKVWLMPSKAARDIVLAQLST